MLSGNCLKSQLPEVVPAVGANKKLTQKLEYLGGEMSKGALQSPFPVYSWGSRRHMQGKDCVYMSRKDLREPVSHLWLTLRLCSSGQ